MISYQIYARDKSGVEIASFTYGIDDAHALVRCRRNFPDEKGWTAHHVRNIDTAAPEEITHLRCADCFGVTLVEELSLATDGRRLCDLCQLRAEQITEDKQELEKAGQERLF